MTEKHDRDPFSSRYDEGEKTAKTDNTAKTEQTDETGRVPVKERTNINMYIADEDLVDELQLRYKKLDLEWQEQYGEDLPKNDGFYPAVLRAALNGTSIEAQLDLE